MKRVLFFNHEQRRLYFHEPAYLEVYKPIVESGLATEAGIYVYQREIRWLRSLLSRKVPEAELATTIENILFDLISHKIEEFRPTHIINSVAWPEDSIQASLWRRIRQAHSFYLTSIIWDHDEARDELQNFDRETIKISDRTILADSLSRVQRIKSKVPPYQSFSDVDRVVFCPTVPAPSIFFPRAEKKHDVSLVGSSEGYRVKVEEALRQAQIPFARIGGLVGKDKFLTDEEYAREISLSRIVINTQTMPTRIQLKGRVAQVLSCGTFLLEQENEESRRYLEGIPVVFWKDEDDLIQKLKHYVHNEAERAHIAEICHREWSRRYSAEKFARVVLGVDDADLA